MNRPPQESVLAVSAFSRGFAFVLFEGPDNPFDWGVKEIRDRQKNIPTLQGIKELVDRYRPEAIVITDLTNNRSKQTVRIRKLHRMIKHLAGTEYVEVYEFPRSAVKQYFEPTGSTTKYEIAKTIAQQIPALAHRMPPYRKAWMSADPRLYIFDAAALALAFYGSRGVPSPFDPVDKS
jgi:hypothetical protein